MHNHNLRWILITAVFGVITSTQAEVLYEGTFTGAELPGVPGIDMASARTRSNQWNADGYRIEGDSLVFLRSNTGCDGDPVPPLCEQSEKLLELPLAQSIPAGHIVTVSLSATLSHDFPILNMGMDSSDPHIMLSDGTQLAGVVVLDVEPTGGGTDLAYCTDEGDMCYPMGYPSPANPGARMTIVNSPGTDYDTYNINVTWTLGATTSVEATLWDFDGHPGAVFSGFGTIPSAVGALDSMEPLSLVFLSDNQNNEMYQIDSLSIVVESYEILSCNCSTPTLFDPPADRDITVKKGNRVLPLKFTLCDENGFPVTDVSPPVAEVDFAGTLDMDPDFYESDQFLSAGHGDDGNEFVNIGDHWQLNLQTKMFIADGVYEIYAVSPDPAEYVISPTCSLLFEITD